MSVNEIRFIIENNPFIKENHKNEAFMYVVFFLTNSVCFNEELIKRKTADNESIVITEKAAYLYCPNGYGRTKLTNSYLEKTLQVASTTRNWKTVNQILKIASAMS